jgi:uncharacterized protein (DUF488 family)
VKIYTIGFTKKSAAQFFEVLKRSGIKRLIDIRLNNQSQLAGFTKQDDLKYFLKKICGIDYMHVPRLAPSKEILEGYRDKKITWEEYEKMFLDLLDERQVSGFLKEDLFKIPTVLLCSEPKPDQCHRRLVAEYLRKNWNNLSIIHL